MSVSPFPPQGYCINLDRRPDRWKQFDDHKKDPVSCNLFNNTQRLSAVDGRRFQPKLSKTNAGALGCTLSHIHALTLLQKSARHPHEIVMVVEDDVQVLEPIQLQKVVQGWDRLAKARDWHVLTFTASGPIQTQRRQTDDNLGLVHVINAHSTTGYLVRQLSIPHLLQVFHHSAMQLQQGASRRHFALDVAWLELQRKIPFLTFDSMTMTQRMGVSDIEHAVTDYSPLFAHSTLRGNKRIFFVCSYGGSGSKLLCKHLTNYGMTLHIHSRKPPPSLEWVGNNRVVGPQYFEWFNGVPLPPQLAARISVIFIYRNPVRAVLSRYHNPIHRRHVQVPDASVSIEDAVKAQRDLFAIGEFFNNYLTSKRNYKIHFVKYDVLFNKMNELHKTLKLPTPVSNLKRKEKDRDQTHAEALARIYADLTTQMDSMAAIETH